MKKQTPQKNEKVNGEKKYIKRNQRCKNKKLKLKKLKKT